MFSRAKSIPASTSCSILSEDDDAGPIVAMIFARRLVIPLTI